MGTIRPSSLPSVASYTQTCCIYGRCQANKAVAVQCVHVYTYVQVMGKRLSTWSKTTSMAMEPPSPPVLLLLTSHEPRERVLLVY